MWHMCNNLKVHFTAGQVLFSWGLGLAVKRAVLCKAEKQRPGARRRSSVVLYLRFLRKKTPWVLNSCKKEASRQGEAWDRTHTL